MTIGALHVNFWLALLGGLGLILGPMYTLYLYRRVIFGRLTKPDLRALLDVTPREIAVFAPLLVLAIWMGVYPSSFTRFWDSTVAQMVAQHEQAMAAPPGPARVQLAEAARR